MPGHLRSRSPIVDRALIDPLAIPSGVDLWLRRIEETAWDLLERSREALDGSTTTLIVLRESRDELATLLEDERRSTLHRILRRPLGQLELDTPAARSFH